MSNAVQRNATQRNAVEPAPVGVKLPPHLLERLDAHVSRMREATPGVDFTRSDAIRTLLLFGLDAVESK